MNKVIGMLAVLAFTASAANAQLLKNFKYDGQIEVNAYNTNNMDFDKTTSDAKSFVDTRLMLNTGFDLNEDVNAVVSAVKNNRQYGQASESVTSAAGTGVLDNVYFEQAYLNLKGVIGMDHKVGRQYYGNAGDMVIYYGPKMQPYISQMPVTAIDGWTGWYKNGNWDVNAIVAKEKQAATTPPTSGLDDTNISGVNVNTKISRWNLNAYAYQKSDKASTKIDQLNLVGVKGNWECMFVKNLNIGVEYDQDMGFSTNTLNNHRYEGYAFKANVDYSMNLKGKLAFAGEYVLQSGDGNKNDRGDMTFHGISGDYRPGIIFGGQWLNGEGFKTGSGLNTYNLGANWTPDMLNKLNLAITYYDFSAAKRLDNTGALLSDKHLGTEADVVATWTHSASVSLNGYYAMFKPEQNNFSANENHNTAQMFGAALNVKF
jgi:hypothetical protein